MEEREFNGLAEAMLQRIEAAVEALVEQGEIDLDIELKPGGILELECENGTKIIVNRHGAAREIWVAARSGGYHFRPTESAGEWRWLGTRDGEDLLAVLSRCLAEQTGAAVRLA